MSLDGIWKSCSGSDLAALAAQRNFGAWDDVTVPSFMSMHRRAMPGVARRYVCKRVVEVKEEWADKSLYLRFESVNGFCEIFIDGQSIGKHQNSFIAFGFDITPRVRGKKSFVLTVAVEELTDKVSTFSVGGILRSAALYILPNEHFTMLRAVTAFDSQFRRAQLNVTYALNAANPALSLWAVLLDPMGMTVAQKELNPVAPGDLCGADTLPVENPLPWDTEHPWLYTLCLRLQRGGLVTEETRLRVGLRQINRAGNRLYVNGQEVKLRGSCRHEISPLNGRCLTPELIREDVKLFKEANCNYIRTSHYPPSEYFLELCD